MRQDKDRTVKWLLTHHGESILRLAGFREFTTCRPVATELVAPRRLPDGVLEVTFPGRSEPDLVLVEIESYPGKDVDPQVLDDMMLIAVDRGRMPEVVSIVLHPKGNQTVSGTVDRTSRQGTTKLSASWPVIRVWELAAEDLLATGDPGLIPWVPLTKSDRSPAELLTECRDRLSVVSDRRDQAGLMAVTAILSGLAFPGVNVLTLLGGPSAMIESPVLEELKDYIRKQFEAEFRQQAEAERKQAEAEIRKQAEDARVATLRENITANLEARFGSVSTAVSSETAMISDAGRLRELLRLAATCPDMATFVADLARE